MVKETSFSVSGFTVSLHEHLGEYYIGISTPSGNNFITRCKDRDQAQTIFYKELEALSNGEFSA